MLSETLITALKGYDIGSKIRRLRLRKKLGLVELSNTPVSRQHCCRKLNGGICFRRYRPC